MRRFARSGAVLTVTSLKGPFLVVIFAVCCLGVVVFCEGVRGYFDSPAASRVDAGLSPRIAVALAPIYISPPTPANDQVGLHISS
jgi:hypothetical protein